MKSILPVVAAAGIAVSCLTAASDAAAFTTSAPHVAQALPSNVIRVSTAPQGQVKPHEHCRQRVRQSRLCVGVTGTGSGVWRRLVMGTV